MNSKNKENKKGKYKLIKSNDPKPGLSSYSLVSKNGKDVSSANKFLDFSAVCGLSEQTIRSYGFALLKLWRWFEHDNVEIPPVKQFNLVEYIHFQHKESTQNISPRSINQRLCVARVFYQWITGKELDATVTKNRYARRYFGNTAHEGYVGSFNYKSCTSLHVKEEQRVIQPLTRKQVSSFFESMHTHRNLSIVALMVLCGLRSNEVITIDMDNLNLKEGTIIVCGKRNKERMIPLHTKVLSLLKSYLNTERPQTSSQKLFVCFKGVKRGHSMTRSGLRSLFRYHRISTGIIKANPHRFRHTFGTEMIRAGVSLLALMQLMGHSNIQTTMNYVKISQNEVWEQFYRAADKLQNLGHNSDGNS